MTARERSSGATNTTSRRGRRLLPALALLAAHIATSALAGEFLAPKLRKKVEPAMPPGVTLSGNAVEDVTLRVIVDRKGKVALDERRAGKSPWIDEVERAVAEWRYEPARQDREPVAVYLLLTYRFRSPEVGASGLASTTVDSSPVAPIEGEDRTAPPQLLNRVLPVYPPEAWEAGLEGEVIVNFVVGTDGATSDVEAVAGPSGFHAAAVNAVRQWTYKPALHKGRPQPAPQTVTLRFRKIGDPG